MKKYCPDMVRVMAMSISEGIRDGDFFRYDAEIMEDVEDISSRLCPYGAYAEGTCNPVDPGWRDIGSWYALWQERRKDGEGNALQGDVLVRQQKIR